MVPLPEGCEDLTLADIADTDIEEFKDKTMHKPDHVLRELVELRRQINNRKATHRSRTVAELVSRQNSSPNYLLGKLRTEHEELRLKNEQNEVLIGMMKAEIERLREEVRDAKMEKELEHNHKRPRC